MGWRGDTYEFFEDDEVHLIHALPCCCRSTYATLRRVEKRFGVNLLGTMILVTHKNPDASKWCSYCGIRICFWCGGRRSLREDLFDVR